MNRNVMLTVELMVLTIIFACLSGGIAFGFGMIVGAGLHHYGWMDESNIMMFSIVFGVMGFLSFFVRLFTGGHRWMM